MHTFSAQNVNKDVSKDSRIISQILLLPISRSLFTIPAFRAEFYGLLHTDRGLKSGWKFTTIKLIFSRFCEYTNIFASGDDWIKHQAFSFSRTNINPGCKTCRIKVGLLVHYLKLDIVDQCIFVPAVHCNPAFISSIFRGPGFIDIKSSAFSHFQQSDLFNWHLWYGH